MSESCVGETRRESRGKSLQCEENPRKQTGLLVTQCYLTLGSALGEPSPCRGWLSTAAIFTCFWNRFSRINTHEVCFSQCSRFLRFPTVNICVRAHFPLCTNGKSCSPSTVQSGGGRRKKDFCLHCCPAQGSTQAR